MARNWFTLSTIGSSLPTLKAAENSPNDELTKGSPSPLNGERAGVRGETVRLVPVHGEQCRTPERFASQGASDVAPAFWSAAVLCRFRPLRLIVIALTAFALLSSIRAQA